ncbi:hypothetical protein [Polaribacter gochangensis]|uniref:hypothetical protein n=1 Tax=Polaribacter gochangensis TaxID=3252903 RepID=UPI0039047BD4
MKQFPKIIALFFFIFIAGIFISVVKINTSLNLNTSPESVKIQKDSIYLKQLNTKTI